MFCLTSALASRTLPPQEMDEDLVDFLLDAPAPDSALVQQTSGELAYHVACATRLEPWALPRTGVWARVEEADVRRPPAVDSGSAAVGKVADTQEGELGASVLSGSLSPVTPPDALSEVRQKPRADTLVEHRPAARVARPPGQAGSRPGCTVPSAGVYRVFTGPPA